MSTRLAPVSGAFLARAAQTKAKLTIQVVPETGTGSYGPTRLAPVSGAFLARAAQTKAQLTIQAVPETGTGSYGPTRQALGLKKLPLASPFLDTVQISHIAVVDLGSVGLVSVQVKL